jgi:hypothetical protein
MSFLYPTFLWALTAVSIPIIIHLFNFRRYKKVKFTNVRFLQELKEQTQSKQILRHLLVLLMRCLAIICLVIAFAQPFFKKQQGNGMAGDHIVSVYIDNSFSMAAAGTEGELLEQAKNKARDIAKAYRGSDFFQVITNDFEGRHQRLVNKEEFLKLVDEVKLSPQSHTLSEVLNRQSEALSHARGSKQVFWLSDFQKSECDFNNINADSTLNIQAFALEPGARQNIYIDSCWFETPYIALNETSKLNVRIRNESDKNLENESLVLKMNDVQKALASFTVNKNSSVTAVLSFTASNAGWNSCKLQITDNPITFDDNLYFSFYVDENIPVLSINAADPNKYITAVYASNAYFRLNQVNYKNINYDDLKNYKLIILNEADEISSGLQQQLKQYAEKGGSLLILPSSKSTAPLPAYNDFLRSLGLNSFSSIDAGKNKVSELNTQTDVFRDVFEKIQENTDMPDVSKAFVLDNAVIPGRETLLKMNTGNPLLSRYGLGSGLIYLSAAPFHKDWTMLPQHALFVPLMYKLALLGNRQLPLYYMIGRDKVVQLKQDVHSGEEVMTLKSDQEETVPEITNENGRPALYISEILRDGNYKLMYGRNSDSTVQVISYNYSRSESALSYFSEDELGRQFASRNIANMNAVSNAAEKAIIETQVRNSLWKWFVMLTLAFLAAEVLILRFYNPAGKKIDLAYADKKVN